MTSPTTGEARAGGEADRFAAWVRPHLPAMGRFAARLVPAADRDDVVQDALVRAWRRRSTYEESRGSAAAWLLAIVADQARRRRTRAPAPNLTLVEADGTSPFTSADLDLERAIAALSPRQRQAVDLYYLVGLDVAGTAQVMGCATGTVKATLSQARDRLRTLLGDDLEDDSGEDHD
jgi:RNA polymerase sigma factor (sigma-70 family)